MQYIHRRVSYNYEYAIVRGTYIWNIFDFASNLRDEGGLKGINNKGLVTHDRKTRKDSFYIYKPYWSNEAVLRKDIAPLFEHSMFAMIKTFSIEKLVEMKPDMFPKSYIYKINTELNKISKK